MKIIIFGTGQMYRENRDCISYNDEIIGFLDNNQKLWGIKVDGKIVYNPGEILNIEFDKIILNRNGAADFCPPLFPFAIINLIRFLLKFY